MIHSNRKLAWFLLFFLGFVWGASFLLMKKGLVHYTPVQVAALRLVMAGTLLMPVALLHMRRMQKKEIFFCFLSGLLGNAIPAFLFPLAQKTISSSLAGIINGMTPIFALLLGALFFGVTLSRYKVIGVVIGLLGAMVIVLSGKSKLEASAFTGPLMAISATIMYGFNVNLIKSKLSHLPPLAVAGVPLGLISIPAWFVFAFSGTGDAISADFATGFHYLPWLILLSLAGTAFSLILFNRLLQISTALFASFTTYLIPLFAVMWGLIDHESIGLVQIIGMALILLGIIVGSFAGNTKTEKQ